MSQIFSPKIVTKTPSRNRFNLSYYNRVTTRMGDLTPVLCKKILPGDRWRVSLSSITRLAPLANPVYDRVKITFDAFFVQNRIIDPDWKNYVSPDLEVDDNPTTGMIFHIADLSNNQSLFKQFFGRGSLFDYLGIQFNKYEKDGTPSFALRSGQDFKASAYPFLGYVKIWDNWYRNERFQSSVYNALMRMYLKPGRTVTVSPTIISSLSFSTYGFLSVNYGKDLYTTALSEPLIGGPVNIPSGNSTPPIAALDTNGDPFELSGKSDGTNINIVAPSGVPGGTTVSLVADMKTAVLGTIQELKFAYALFSFYMKDTYNGNRYVEFMQAHFGVTVPDSTLERSLFLGRVTQWINFSEIFQTSGATGAEENGGVLGDYSGVGSATGSGRLFDYNFLEHGYLYILMSIRPNSTYFQGIDRKFFYGDRFDELYFPEFQNIGDKPIYTLELYNDNVNLPPDNINLLDFSWQKVNASTIFGYNRANAEYVWFHDEMHGNFLNKDSEYNWTFARSFDSAPVLGSKFSTVPAINNPFTYTAEDSLNFYTDILFNIAALRPVVRNEHY